MLQQYSQTLSVAVQTARAKCVIIARDRLTLHTAPSVPFINGPIVHVRYDALTPPCFSYCTFTPCPALSSSPLNTILTSLTTGDTSRVPVVM